MLGGVREVRGELSEEFVCSSAEAEAFLNHEEKLLATASNCRLSVNYEEVRIPLTLLVELEVLGEEFYPFQAELEHLGGEVVYPLDVCLGSMGRQSYQGVEVDEELTSEELGAIKGALKAPELARYDLLDFVRESHLVDVVQVVISQSGLRLPGVANGVLAKRGYPR